MQAFIAREGFRDRFTSERAALPAIKEAPSPSSVSVAASWDAMLARLRAPIAPRSWRADEVPHDIVEVHGHALHRLQCRVTGSGCANGDVARDETIGLVSADLASLLGFRRLEALRQSIAAAATLTLSTPASSADALALDRRVVVTLQRLGVVPCIAGEGDAEPPSPVALGLAIMALRRYEIVTLRRCGAPR